MMLAETKACSKCGTVKPLSAYSPKKETRLGVQSACKECAAADYREQYKNSLEFRERTRARMRLITRSGAFREYQRQRRQAGIDVSRNTPEWAAKARKNYRRKHPERERAWSRLRYAIKMGRVIRQACCVCGDTATGHHEDYSKPLDVMWLCRKHHIAWHRNFVPRGNAKTGDVETKEKP